MSVKVCYQDHKGQLVTKYFKSERALLDTLLNEARMIESIRRSKPRSENDLLLTREKYLLDLMDKYASPQTKKEWEFWEQKRGEEKRLKEHDANYLAPNRATKSPKVAEHRKKETGVSTGEFLKIRRNRLRDLDNQILRAANDPKKRMELRKEYEQEEELISAVESLSNSRI